MTVKELMEKLSQMDPNAPVYFAYDSGDYWGNQKAEEVYDVETGCITDYYKGGYQVATGDDEDEDEDDYIDAVILG
ncbi:MAG: hypothetical protein R3321_00290 [Nitrososphaeraceae archaeon]|nr:hypothetical protein [Nitrososphaeraceae archaeon]